MTRSKQSKANKAGKFLPSGGASPQGHQKQQPSPRRPFVPDSDVDRKVVAQQGMAAAAHSSEKGMFINFDIDEHLQDLQIGEKEKMGDLLARAVKAAIEAAVPAIVKAVKDVCLSAMKEEINPHLLRLQYKTDQLDQQGRRDNLRISGLAEEKTDEESEEMLASKVCKVAVQAGIELKGADISSCHRLGKKSGDKSRQTFVQITTRRKRDALYNARFSLKGKDGCDGIYINEDLTPMRYAVLRAAKRSEMVKRVSTKHGNVICKMTNDDFITISSPDDLFDVGLDTIDYKEFRLHFMV